MCGARRPPCEGKRRSADFQSAPEPRLLKTKALRRRRDGQPFSGAPPHLPSLALFQELRQKASQCSPITTPPPHPRSNGQ